jgi:WD40 repeat protein
VLELRGHTDFVGGARFSDDGHLLASFSWDGTVKVWATSDGSEKKSFDEHHAIVEDCDFIGKENNIVSIGDDGHLYLWNMNNEPTRALLTTPNALISLQVLRNTNEVVTRDTNGSLWVLGPATQPRLVRKGTGIEFTFMRASRDGAFIAVGQEDGRVIAYRTEDWSIVASASLGGTPARIEFDPQNRDIFSLTEDGFVHVTALKSSRDIKWNRLPIAAHDISYDPTGNTLAISALDGGSWFYSVERAQWSYLIDHAAPTFWGSFTPDGSQFVTIDKTGLAVIRDSSSIKE